MCWCVWAAGSAVRAAAYPPAEELPSLHGSRRVVSQLCWTPPPVQGSVLSSLRLLPHGSAGASRQASLYHRLVEKHMTPRVARTTSKHRKKLFICVGSALAKRSVTPYNSKQQSRNTLSSCWLQVKGNHTTRWALMWLLCICTRLLLGILGPLTAQV